VLTAKFPDYGSSVTDHPGADRDPFLLWIPAAGKIADLVDRPAAIKDAGELVAAPDRALAGRD
jgi:hypothetical protein